MYILSLNFMILQVCGMWRPSTCRSSGWKSNIYGCYTFAMTLSLYLFALSQFIDLVISSEDVEEFVHGSYMFLSVFASCAKTANLIGNQNEIIDLINVLNSDLCKCRNDDEEQIIVDCEREARSNTFWYSALGETGVFFIILRSFVFDIPRRNLPYNGWIPYNLESSVIGFWFAYFHQHIALATGALINGSFDTLVPGLMIHTCARIKILKSRIENIPQSLERQRTLLEMNYDDYHGECDEPLEFELLRECIKHHTKIFRIAESLKDIFGKIVLFQFALSSLILCVSVYEISGMKIFSTEFAANSLYLPCMIIQIFIYCFYGGELTLQSEDVNNAVYRMDRTSLHMKTKKSLVTMMMRSQRPITFTCGYIITLSLDSFNSLIKLSYSVYNFLQQSSK